MQQCAIVLAALLVLTLPRLCFAAAWTLPRGQWELIKNAYYYTTSEYFDDRGIRRAQPSYTKYEINPYSEYGLQSGTTIGASVSFNAVTGTREITPTLSVSGTNYGLADPAFFVRQRLWQSDNAVLSVQPLIKLPSYYSNSVLPRSGTSQTDGELRILGGYGFNFFRQHHFINLEAAYRKRMGDPGDQLRLDATLGVTLNERWQILPQLSVINTTGGRSPLYTQNTEDDYDLVKPQFSAVYRFNETVALQAGAFTHLSGNNTGAGGGGMLSLWVKP